VPVTVRVWAGALTRIDFVAKRSMRRSLMRNAIELREIEIESFPTRSTVKCKINFYFRN
jgi:hypothetical protein